MLNSLNHGPNPFKMQHMSEIFKLNFFYLLSIYSLTTWPIGILKKIRSRFLKRLIKLLKLSKTSTCHIWCFVHFQKDNFIKHHLFPNLLVTTFCVFTSEDYFLVYFSMLSHTHTHTHKQMIMVFWINLILRWFRNSLKGSNSRLIMLKFF